MLSYQLLKNHAGLLLVGDYTSLRWLHEVVHDVNERSPLIKDDESPFLGLAYDARKAYQSEREILPAPQSYEEMRSEEHTSELQSLMRISYAVFCLKKKKTATKPNNKTSKHIITYTTTPRLTIQQHNTHTQNK